MESVGWLVGWLTSCIRKNMVTKLASLGKGHTAGTQRFNIQARSE
jgi:hypothetical protein